MWLSVDFSTLKGWVFRRIMIIGIWCLPWSWKSLYLSLLCVFLLPIFLWQIRGYRSWSTIFSDRFRSKVQKCPHRLVCGLPLILDRRSCSRGRFHSSGNRYSRSHRQVDDPAIQRSRIPFISVDLGFWLIVCKSWVIQVAVIGRSLKLIRLKWTDRTVDTRANFIVASLRSRISFNCVIKNEVFRGTTDRTAEGPG